MTLQMQTRHSQKQQVPSKRTHGPFGFSYFPALSAPLLKQEQTVFHADTFPFVMFKTFSSIFVADHQHIVAEIPCA